LGRQNPNSGFLWAAFPPYHSANQKEAEGSLVAYDASRLDGSLGFKRITMIWHSRQVPTESFKQFAKFCCPTIANGKIYQATADDSIAIYGLKTIANTFDLGFDGAGEGFALNGSPVSSSNAAHC
jgi:hypothetical protein